MSGSCQTCGGLIMEQGKVYGYSGPVCYCQYPNRGGLSNYDQSGSGLGNQGGLGSMQSQYIYDVINKILATLVRIEEKLNEKKISYANIEKKVLKMTIGECYGLGDYTLQDELDKYGEDIIVAQYNLKVHQGPTGAYPYIEWFRAWTATKAMCMVSSGFGDNVILALEREVPPELLPKEGSDIKWTDFVHKDNPFLKLLKEQNGRVKEKRKRTKRSNSKTNKRKR